MKFKRIFLMVLDSLGVGETTDAINFDDVGAKSIRDIVEHLSKKFPTNTVIALPDKVSLESCSKDVLENIISMIAEIIDQL